MNKIYPNDLVKFIQKQLDSPNPDVYSFLVKGLKESFEELSLKLNLKKDVSFGKNTNEKDFMRLVSNVNHVVFFIVKFEELGTNKEVSSQKVFEIDYAKDEIVSKMRETFK